MCPGGEISIMLPNLEKKVRYNAVKFVLGQFTDVHNGSLCAELSPANMSLENNAAASGQLPVPPLCRDTAPDGTGDLTNSNRESPLTLHCAIIQYVFEMREKSP